MKLSDTVRRAVLSALIAWPVIVQAGSPVEEAGDRFAASGYFREAGAQYEKALIGDAGNFGLRTKLAETRLSEGRIAEAHAVYLEGLLALLNSQPLTAEGSAAPSLANTTSAAYRENYRPFIAGAIATLPVEGESSFTVVQGALEKALADARQSAGGKITKTLSFYPRVQGLAEFARTFATRTGRYEFARRWDALLRQSFDAPAPVATPGVSTFEQDLARARLQKDASATLGVYQGWFTTLAQSPPADDSRGPQITSADVVMFAHDQLDTERYKAFCRFVFDAIKKRPELARDLIFNGDRGFSEPDAFSSVLLDIEHKVGRELLDEATFRRIAAGGKPANRELDSIYLASRLTPERQVEEFKRLITVDSGGSVKWGQAIGVLRLLLAHPLSAATSRRLDTVLKEGLMQLKTIRGGLLAEGAGQLSQGHLGVGIDRSNVALLEGWDSYLTETHAKLVPPGLLKIGLLRDLGQEQVAIPLVVDAALAVYATPGASAASNVVMATASGPRDPEAESRAAMANFLRPMAAWIYPKYRAEIAAAVDKKEATLGRTPAVLMLQAQLRAIDPDAVQMPKAAQVPKATQGAAKAAAASASANAPVSGGPGGFDNSYFTTPMTKKAIQSVFALEQGGKPEDARAGLRQLWRLTMLFDPTVLPAGVEFGFGSSWVQFQYDWLIELNWGATSRNAGGRGTFFAKLSEYDFATAELEAQWHGLYAQAVDENQPLYAALATAYERRGLLAARVQQLTDGLDRGLMGPQELVLLTELMGHLPQQQIRRQLPLAERKLTELRVSSGYPRLLIARMHAALGKEDQAVRFYHEAFIARLSPPTYGITSVNVPSLTALALYEDTKGRLKRPARDALLSGFMRMLSPDEDPAKRELYARFLMRVLEADPQSTLAQSALTPFLNDGVTVRAPVDLVKAVRVMARTGQRAQSLQLLKTVLKRSVDPESASFGFGGMAFSSGQMRAMMRTQDYGARLLYGFRMPPNNERDLLDDLFTPSSEPWPQESAWLTELSRAVNDWSERGEIDAEAGATALALTAERSKQLQSSAP